MSFRSNYQRFYTSSVEHCRISGLANTNNWIAFNNKLGVGTKIPDQKLHVEFANTDTSFSGGSGGAWDRDWETLLV